MIKVNKYLEFKENLNSLDKRGYFYDNPKSTLVPYTTKTPNFMQSLVLLSSNSLSINKMWIGIAIVIVVILYLSLRGRRKMRKFKEQRILDEKKKKDELCGGVVGRLSEEPDSFIDMSVCDDDYMHLGIGS